MFKNHPRGLQVLFFTEMWERFGYYLMIGIFSLYMMGDLSGGGLGFDPLKKSVIYGNYIALVYLTPFIGGLLADRILGYRKAVMIGGVLMGLGYLGLSIPGDGPNFYASLALIITGNGFFKPNISTLVGNLYGEERYRALKDNGYSIFYMGINVGGFLCNFVAAILRNNFGWGYAFAAAGVGMFVGVTWFALGTRHLAAADVLKPAKPGDLPVSTILGIVFIPALLFGAAGWYLPTMLLGRPLISAGSPDVDAFVFACIPVAYYYYSLWKRQTGEDRVRVGALLPIFAVVVVFWAVFHQNGDALTEWAEKFTAREMPAAAVPACETIRLVQEVDTTPREVAVLDARDRPAVGPEGEPLKALGPDPYFRNVPKENWPPAGATQKLWSTELFQSVNPGFVVLLTPLLIGVFAWLRRRGREPSTAAKIAIGLLISALSTIPMILAATFSDNGAVKVSMGWLFLTYGIITVGELCLSPMGLSLVSKVSPPAYHGPDDGRLVPRDRDRQQARGSAVRPAPRLRTQAHRVRRELRPAARRRAAPVRAGRQAAADDGQVHAVGGAAGGDPPRRGRARAAERAVTAGRAGPDRPGRRCRSSLIPCRPPAREACRRWNRRRRRSR